MTDCYKMLCNTHLIFIAAISSVNSAARQIQIYNRLETRPPASGWLGSAQLITYLYITRSFLYQVESDGFRFSVLCKLCAGVRSLLFFSYM